MLQLVRSAYPYDAWLSYGAPPGAWVRVRLFWHVAPLQINLVQDLLRASAAQLLPIFDQWTLTPERPWLTSARRLAGGGQLPIPPQYEPASHFAEYRRLLPSHSFRIEAGLNEKPNSQAASAVERSLLWLSNFWNAEVLFFVSGEAMKQSQTAERESWEPEIIAPPPPGKPHPLSLSEQKLARWIADDVGLAGLFAFNKIVKLSPFSQPCVDLLWADGKLVVEIDDSSHWQRDKYAADRQRDYELISQGFIVLRITANEVLSDTAKALEKIRTCVKLRGTLNV